LSGQTAHPAGDEVGVTVPASAIGIQIGRERRLALREFRERAEIDPLQREFLDHDRSDIACERNADHGAGGNVQSDTELEEEVTARALAVPARLSRRL